MTPHAVSQPAAPRGASLEAMVDSLPDYAILMLDRDGRVTSWNAGAERLTGRRAAEMIGSDRAAIYPVEDVMVGRLTTELTRARRRGRLERHCWRVRRDGSRFWASVVTIAVTDDDGEVSGYGQVIRDVTDTSAAMQALRRSEARLRSFAESASDAILSANADGQIVGWNAAAARLYGYTAPEAIGQPVTMLVPEGRQTLARERMATLLSPDAADGEAVKAPTEMLALRADGAEVPIEVSIGTWEDGGEHNFTAIIRDITERKRSDVQLQYLADHDPLTGLLNRHRFESELERMVSEADRYARRAALLILDLDGFKEVNDVHGHSAGDEVIAKVGELLTGIVRESDVVARLGGDEFGVIVQQADRAQAEVVAEKIIETVRSRGVVFSDLARAHVTASVGITVLEPGGRLTAEELLLQADRAMYDAKARGRNRHAVHEAERGEHVGLPERHSWLRRLREALADDKFELHAQPIVSIRGERCPRYELLLRLRDSNGELVGPGAFLVNAERFDLIGEIDRWVLGQAVGLLHDHHRAGQEISLTVNLSAKTLNDLALAEDLRAMLEAHPIPPGRLVVEVTETAAIVNIARAAELARELRALGCLFALDDFGSGFASFYYLKHLEFDYLKIDGEFIGGLVQTPSDQLVVRAVVDIARGLGSETIAEFVQDEETLRLLHEFGVDYGQGYHLGRPEPLCERLPELTAS